MIMIQEGKFPLSVCNRGVYRILEKHKGKKHNN